MRVTLLLFAFGAFAIAMLSLGLALRTREFRGEVHALVASVEAQVMGYAPAVRRGKQRAVTAQVCDTSI
jgi:hypothetical protein